MPTWPQSGRAPAVLLWWMIHKECGRNRALATLWWAQPCLSEAIGFHAIMLGMNFGKKFPAKAGARIKAEQHSGISSQAHGRNLGIGARMDKPTENLKCIGPAQVLGRRFHRKKRGVKKPNHCGYDELVIHKAAVAPAFAVKVNKLERCPTQTTSHDAQ